MSPALQAILAQLTVGQLMALTSKHNNQSPDAILITGEQINEAIAEMVQLIRGKELDK